MVCLFTVFNQWGMNDQVCHRPPRCPRPQPRRCPHTELLYLLPELSVIWLCDTSITQQPLLSDRGGRWHFLSRANCVTMLIQYGHHYFSFKHSQWSYSLPRHPSCHYLKIEVIYLFLDHDSRELKGDTQEFMWIPGHRVGSRWQDSSS